MPVSKTKLVPGGRKDLDVKDSGKRWNLALSYEPKKHKNTLLDIMSGGGSIYQVARALGVCVETLEKWGAAFPEFGEALKAGKDFRRAWLDQGFQDAMNEEFNYKGYTIALTADYGYNDKAPNINIDMTKADDDAVKVVTDIIQDLHKTTI